VPPNLLFLTPQPPSEYHFDNVSEWQKHKQHRKNLAKSPLFFFSLLDILIVAQRKLYVHDEDNVDDK
jgi:hypothetical protein